MTEEVFAFPTSYAQQRLWFLDQLEPESSFYNVFDTLSFTGPLDVGALEQSLNEVVRRHEALRTTFTSVDGQPLQVIAPSMTLQLPVVDLSALAEAERDMEVGRVTVTEFERPFDLNRGPLLRAMLLRLSAEEHMLLTVMHHIIADGWSLRVLTRELRTLYEAYSAGQPSPLPELPIQYADFTLWQRDWLQGEVLESQLSYWKRQLAGAPPVLKLPTDRARPSVQSFRGASQQVGLPESLTTALKSLSQREGATLFMTLLAAFGVLLHRYTNQEDLVVGSPIAGRNRAETEELIGFFVNTLAMRVDVAGDPTFSELLGRVRDVALGAYSHQDLPFEMLVEAVQPERSLSHHPVFQVMFQLIGAQMADEESAASSLFEDETESDGRYEIQEGTAKFDLSMDIVECGERMLAAVEYNTDLFEHMTVRRLLLNFRELLTEIVARPGARLSEFNVLCAAERDEVLREWNDKRCDFSSDKCIHELFERQVERTPLAVAVVSEREQLTYRELDERANRLAHYLKSLGVGPDSLVGLCVERSVEMLVGMFGILKAGGAYVPLDPAYPKQRLALMLEDARACVLLTEERLLDSLPEHTARVVCLDTDWERIEMEPRTRPEMCVWPENLAYVIYTSGSMGRPKGVMIQHRSLVNWAARATAEYGLRADDRILQFSSISFDTAVEEIFPCLTLGATLVLRSASMSDSIRTFLEKCRELKITILDLPTAYWHELTWELASQSLKVPPTVRLVIFGGERALPERLSMWHRSVPGSVRLMQGYGPTEITVVATIADLSKHRDAGLLREVPIGYAIGNARSFILDRHLRPVPVGAEGELYIGGEGLARGYLSSPALTAERFIPDPFSAEPGARLYRTGDLARYLSDGEIEFLGRTDEQVKIRGYRIELGEVEALLREHDEVREAIVTVREDVPGQKRLIAYLIADQSNGFSLAELRRNLGERLPDYMMPSSFVLLQELPMTPSGKVNRRALPEPSLVHDDSQVLYIPPRNETERVVASIWQDVFRTERLSIHSNFFDLGGHSLILVRVHSRLRDHFRKEISMIDMFKYPTISSLSDYLSQDELPPGTIETPRYEQIYERAERQKGALGRRKQMAEQRALVNE